MSVNLDIRMKGGVIGSVGGQPIPYRFSSPLANMPTGVLRLFAGVGVTQVNVAFVKPFTILTTANLDIDLTTGQTDINNVAVNLTKVKFIYCQLTSQGLTDYLKLGPQNVTNGFQGPWGGTGATNFSEIRDCPTAFGGGGNAAGWAGWTVDATHRVIRLNNPTANTVNGYLIIAGI